jgi:hypothetical protein
MTGWMRDSRLARAVMTAAFAFALSVRLLVPTGFMPTATPHGLVVKMCGGMNSGASVLIDPWSADDADHSPQDREPQGSPCAFASLSASALLADPVPALAAPAALLHEIVLPPPAALAIARDDFRLPPLRGPPARV